MINEVSEELIKAKQVMKKKMPEFRRIEKYHTIKIGRLDNWRKPKGHHSKVRRGLKWEIKMPKAGRRTPEVLRNHDKFGREFIKIRTVEDLKLLTQKTVGILVSKLGLKSKLIIATKALGKGYKFLNFNPERIMKKAETMLNAKKNKPKIEVKEKAAEKAAEKPQKPMAKPISKNKNVESKVEKPKITENAKPNSKAKINSKAKPNSKAKAIKPKKQTKGE